MTKLFNCLTLNIPRFSNEMLTSDSVGELPTKVHWLLTTPANLKGNIHGLSGEAPLKTEKCEYELHLDIFILILRTMLQLRRYLTVMQVCSAAEGP